MTETATSDQFASFLRSSGKLAAARQVSSLLFVAAVVALPAIVSSHHVVTTFVWAYFAMMTLASVLGFGFDRLAASMVASRGTRNAGQVLIPLLVVRVLTLPIAALLLWAFFSFVGVEVSVASFVFTLVWLIAALVAPIGFGALRSLGNSTVEPALTAATRTVQSAALVLIAKAGGGVTAFVAVVSVVEMASAVIAVCSVCRGIDLSDMGAPWRQLPMRQAMALAGIEITSLAYLRADLLLVGRMLGASAGAVYGLLYRLLDGLNGVIASFGVWLYAESANQRDGECDEIGLRSRTLGILPGVAIAVALLLVLVAGMAGKLVSDLSDQVDTLRVLIAAFPLLAVNAIEVHVRTGKERTAEVLGATIATLALNVPLCALLISRYGLEGAAIALVASELFQAAVLLALARRDERRMLGSADLTAVLGCAALLVIASALAHGNAVVALVGCAVVAAVVWSTMRRAVVRSTKHHLAGGAP